MPKANSRTTWRISTLVGATLAGMAAIAPMPAKAAEATPPNNSLLLDHPPAGSAMWDNTFPSRAPLSGRQRETARVDQMARTLMRANGAVFAGESSLGAGTSLTH
jgi:hypothetical protein